MSSLVNLSKLYIGLILTLGLSALGSGMLGWQSDSWPRFTVYCLIALVASGLKVSLPGVTGTMSMGFVFVMLGIAELSRSETLLMVALSVLVQSYLHAKAKPKLIQVIFSVSCTSIATALCYDLYHAAVLRSDIFQMPLRLLLCATILFLLNTFSVAVVIALTEHKGVLDVWRATFAWSFPNYLVGAAIAWVMTVASRNFGWQSSLMILPILYLLFRWHSLYVDRIEEEKGRAEEQRVHAEEVASLHWRTIEVLALAIECKDQTTHDHLERVQVYALEVGKELGLTKGELEALRASALLHDIGKLAVPEYIISKPGKLTPEEFTKMKIHPVVGAEILEQVRFPYEVAPIVRSHHEKWDGSGYPDGLAGTNIPIGARILSAVDCLDALASDRQYRRALPLDEAIKIVQKEAGKSFDPVVVDVLARRYVELERMAKSSNVVVKPKLSLDITIDRGAAPAAGFENARSVSSDLAHMQQAIEAADGERKALDSLAYDLERCTARQTVLDLLRRNLKATVGYDAMAVYRRNGDGLVSELVDGDEFRMFAALEVEMGQGLTGWVAENGKPILNGNPSVEPGFLNDPEKFAVLHSALAVPLESHSGVSGVLSLYRRERDAYSKEQLSALLAFGNRLGRALDAAEARQPIG